MQRTEGGGGSEKKREKVYCFRHKEQRKLLEKSGPAEGAKKYGVLERDLISSTTEGGVENAPTGVLFRDSGESKGKRHRKGPNWGESVL